MAQRDEDDLFRAARRFTKSAMDIPMLAPEEEASLAHRWRTHGDAAALHKLTAAHIRLVISRASRFRHYGLPVADLVQEGNLGLMHAAARFDPERGVRFSTYAAWWIRAAMQDYVLRNWSIVRAGATSAQKTLFFALRRMRAQIESASRDTPGQKAAELAERVGVPIGEVESLLARMRAPDQSLDQSIFEDGDTYGSALADDRPTPDEETMARRDGAVRVRLLHEALELLTDRERMIVEERRLGDEPITLEALGAKLGVSKERVRQIEVRALAKIKRAVLHRVGDPVQAGIF